MSHDDESRRRAEFMRRLYELIEYPVRPIRPDIIGARMALDPRQAEGLVRQLVRAEFVAVSSYNGGVWLTDAGKREVEQARTVSVDAEERVPSNVLVHVRGNAYGVQAGTVGSNQYVAVDLAAERPAIEAFLAALRLELDRLPVSGKVLEMARSDLETAEAQLRSPKPRNAILRETVSALREVVLGMAGSGAYVGLVELAQHVHV